MSVPRRPDSWRRRVAVALAIALSGATSALAIAGCDDSDPGVVGPPPRSCQQSGVAPSSLTHLTRVELTHAVADLFGADESLAASVPIDDSTSGFEVGVATSPLLVEQYFAVAENVAAARAGDDGSAGALTGCGDDETCIGSYIDRTGRRAFRRALTDEEHGSLLDLYRTGRTRGGFAGGVRLVVQGILTSADFLYHTEGSSATSAGQLVRLNASERAARLAFLLWRSVPDDALLDAAANGQLETEQDLVEAASRLFADPRSSRMIDDFYRQWLSLDHIDTAIAPDLPDSAIHQMHADISSYVDRITRHGSFRELLIPLDGGIPPIGGGTPGEPVRGILDAPGIMLIFARALQTDPIHRGLFVRQRLLCQQLPPPPPGVIFSVPDTSPGQTTRQRFAVHTQQPACAGCHTLMDPIGFGLEHYDQLGRYRQTEGGLAIDATGEIIGGDDASGPFDGAEELATLLADSDAVHSCFVRQWFRFSMQRIESTRDACSIDLMTQAFEAHGFRVGDLLMSIPRTEAFRNRRIQQVVP